MTLEKVSTAIEAPKSAPQPIQKPATASKRCSSFLLVPASISVAFAFLTLVTAVMILIVKKVEVLAIWSGTDFQLDQLPSRLAFRRHQVGDVVFL